MQLFLLSKSNLKNQRIIKKPHYIFDNFRQNDYDGLVWLVHIIPAFLGARPSEHSGSHSDVCLKLLSTSPGPAPGTKPYPELKIGLVTSTSSHWAPEQYWSYALLLLTLNRSIEEREHFLLLDVFLKLDICFDVCSEEGAPSNEGISHWRDTWGMMSCLASDQQQVARIVWPGCHNRRRLTRCEVCWPQMWHGDMSSPGGSQLTTRGQDAKLFKVHQSFSTVKFLAQIQSLLGTYH